MKKLILIAMIVASSIYSYSQTLDTYNSTGTWSANLTGLYTFPGTPCNLSAATGTLGNILIDVSGDQRVEFNSVRGACINRIWKPLGTTFDNQFNFDFDFRIDVGPANAGIGFYVAALSSTNAPIGYIQPMTLATCGNHNMMDAIAVGVTTPAANSNASPGVFISMVNNGALTIVNGFTINYTTTYYATLKVFDDGRAELTLFTDAGRRIRHNSMCFDMPTSIRGFAFMQHSAAAPFGAGRLTSGWIDNTLVRRNFECCGIEIVGPDTICLSDTADAVYTVNTNGTNPQVQFPAGVTGTFVDGLLTITNWGNITYGPTTVTLTVTSICRCQTITDEIDVVVYPTAQFGESVTTTFGGLISSFTATSIPTVAGTIHTWELWQSNSTGTVLIPPILRGPQSITSGGAGTTWNINVSSPNQLMQNMHYVIIHSIRYPENVCPTVVAKHIYHGESGMISEDINPASLTYQSTRSERIGNTDFNVNIYPNPTSSVIRVEGNAPINSYELIDANGRTVMKEYSGKESIQVDLSAYSKGIYIIKLYYADRVVNERIVVE